MGLEAGGGGSRETLTPRARHLKTPAAKLEPQTWHGRPPLAGRCRGHVRVLGSKPPQGLPPPRGPSQQRHGGLSGPSPPQLDP